MAPLKLNRLTLSGYVKIALILAGLGLALWYIQFQARYFIEGPMIAVEAPLEVVQRDRIISLSGVAQNITDITLNGRKIYTDEKGRFEEPLVLENGYTIVTLVAKDRFGRHTSLSKEFFYTKTTEHASLPHANQN
jgi:hypothetical protein